MQIRKLDKTGHGEGQRWVYYLIEQLFDLGIFFAKKLCEKVFGVGQHNIVPGSGENFATVMEEKLDRGEEGVEVNTELDLKSLSIYSVFMNYHW